MQDFNRDNAVPLVEYFDCEWYSEHFIERIRSERKTSVRQSLEEGTSFYFSREVHHTCHMPRWVFHKLHDSIKDQLVQNETMSSLSGPGSGPMNSEGCLTITLPILAGGKVSDLMSVYNCQEHRSIRYFKKRHVVNRSSQFPTIPTEYNEPKRKAPGCN